jgi:hypothetical protein
MHSSLHHGNFILTSLQLHQESLIKHSRRFRYPRRTSNLGANCDDHQMPPSGAAERKPYASLGANCAIRYENRSLMPVRLTVDASEVVRMSGNRPWPLHWSSSKKSSFPAGICKNGTCNTKADPFIGTTGGQNPRNPLRTNPGLAIFAPNCPTGVEIEQAMASTQHHASS